MARRGGCGYCRPCLLANMVSSMGVIGIGIAGFAYLFSLERETHMHSVKPGLALTFASLVSLAGLCFLLYFAWRYIRLQFGISFQGWSGKNCDNPTTLLLGLGRGVGYTAVTSGYLIGKAILVVAAIFWYPAVIVWGAPWMQTPALWVASLGALTYIFLWLFTRNNP